MKYFLYFAIVYITLLQLGQAQSQDTNKAMELFQQGNRELKKGNIEKAIPLLQKAARLAPQNGEILYTFGLALAEKGELYKAFPVMEKALTLSPSYERHINLAILAQTNNRSDLAIRQYIKALKYKEEGWVCERLSYLYDKKGKEKESLFYLQKGVQLKLVEVRGLKFKKPVEVSMMNRNELQSFLSKEFDKEYRPEDFDKMKKAFLALGFINKDLDLRKIYMGLLAEEVAGFYDPKTKELYLIGEDKIKHGVMEEKEDSPGQQIIVIAHELTHAIQDQYSNIEKLQAYVKGNDDASLSLASLIEGDATLTMIDYQIWPSSVSESSSFTLRIVLRLLFWASPFFAGEEFKKAPDVIQKLLLFPYKEGMFFCVELKKNGGWDAINNAFKNPPLSTEVILHPDKYMIDFPIDFNLPNFSSLLGKDWKELENNVLGEFGIEELLSQFMIPESGKASSGWGGDRYKVYENKEGKLALVWMTTWDSKEDSQEFFEAYKKLLPKKYPGLSFNMQDKNVMKSDEITLRLSGNDVTIIEKVPDSIHETLLDKLSGASRFSIIKYKPGK